MLFYINNDFNDTKYEILAICLTSQQSSIELSGGVIIY